jgi:sarcosine oxidase subunit alpha
VDVAALIDTRTANLPDPRNAPWRIVAGGSIERTHGRQHIDGATVRDAAGARVRIDCDLLSVSNGWDPALHLSCHLGGKPRWDEARQIFLPGASPRGLYAAGAANGAFTLAEALAEGASLGAAAARDLGLETKPFAIPTVRFEESSADEPAWHLPTGRAKAFLDFQNDVTASDAKLALREGYGAVEHLKRYTTLGMATDQGKTGNVAALALIAELTGKQVPEVGTTGFRPPYTPVALGAFAGAHRGRDYRPTRLTPTHAWAEEQGAVFADAGWWLRAQYYRRPGETGWLESVSREAAAVRNGVGLCDVSTLGKIDISGPDAGAFLDRVYVNTFSTLARGRVRYGLMLREDGFAFDDGTVACLSPGHYVITTTTAHAGKVLEHLHFCQQVLWPELDVAIVSVTEQWAQLALAGPRSRDVLSRVVDLGCDVSNAVLPYMALTEATIGGVPARIFRVSFSGERAYEIAVPANYGDALARSLMLAGAAYGITPYGTEALNVLRIEKGHPSGPEIDGRTTARDLGLGKLVSAKKDCIGSVLSGREALIAPERPILVGLKALSRSSQLSAGAHLIPPGEPATAEHEQGHVSSVAYSPSLECEIGLGFLKRGRDRIGEYIRVVDLLRGRDALCEVVDPTFIDPDGVRLRG